MMTHLNHLNHLNNVELVDSLDGALPASRAGHLDACDACRERVDSLRLTMSAVRPAEGDDVPEPSPLFWQHFSRRVHEAVRDEPLAPSSRWFRAPRLGWAAATAVVVLAAAVVLWNQDRRIRDAVPGGSAPIGEQASSTTEDLSWNIDDDEDWALVRVVADDLRWEDAQDAGLHARPGSAERVALEMSPAERQELALLIKDDLIRMDDLLKAEMKRTGA